MQPDPSPPCYFHLLLHHTSKCSQERSHNHTERRRRRRIVERQLASQCSPLRLSPSQERWRRGGQVEEVHLSPCFEVDQVQKTSICSQSFSAPCSSPPLPPPQCPASPPPPPSSAGATPAPPAPGLPQGQRNRSGQGRPRAGADLRFLEAQETGEESPGKVCEIVKVKQQSWWGRRKQS